MPEPETRVNDVAAGRWLAIARIVRPRGRKGEVIAETLTDFPDRFGKLKRAFLDAPPGPPQQVEVAEVWWHGGRLVLRLQGAESIADAKALQGRLLLVPSEERVKPGPDQYYVSDLIGCEVVRNGRRIGEVIGVEPTGGVDLLCVQPTERAEKSSEILIPFAREFCLEIDLVARRILIAPPEGLLELNDEGSGRLET